MRLVLCAMSLLASSLLLVGCGQSGALQLASDPNLDKRAHYLLQSNPVNKANKAKVEQQAIHQADAAQATSETIESK